MQEKEAVNILRKKDIETIIKHIKENNLKVLYWKGGEDHEEEENLWFIDNLNIYDFLFFYADVNLHWSKLFKELVKEIKQSIDYEIDEGGD